MPGPASLTTSCLTCGSRLKVNDPRLVGGIANCPKCGAMVEIKPRQDNAPHQLALGSEAGVDSEALTRSKIDLSESLGVAPPPTGGDLAGDHPDDVSSTEWDTDDPERPRLPSSLDVEASEVWQSETSRRASQLGLVVTLGIFGLLVAVIGFVQFVRTYTQGSQQAVSEAAPPETVESPRDGAEPSAGRDSNRQPPAGAGSDAPDPASDTTDAATDAPDAAVDAPDAAVDPLHASADPAAADTAAAPQQRADQPDRPLAENPLPEIPRLRPPGDQDAPQAAPAPTTLPGIDRVPIAAGDELADRASGDAADSGFGAADALPPGLAKYRQLMDMSTVDAAPPESIPAPPTIDSVQLDGAAEIDLSVDETPRREVDIEKALAMRFAVDQRDASLTELLLLVSQLTTVPVEIELISLDLAGVSATEPVASPSGWMEVGQWLDEILSSAGLQRETVDGRVLVYAGAQRLASELAPVLQLDDFGDPAAETAAWLRPLVGPIDAAAGPVIGDLPIDILADDDPGWVFNPDGPRIHVPAERSVLIRTALALESARMARGIPPRLPRPRTRRWAGAWQSAGQAADQPEHPTAAGRDDKAHAIGDWPIAVGEPTGPTLDSPRTIAGMLRTLGKANDASVIVSWHDAMRHHVHPADLTMPLMDGLPSGEVIDEMVGEAGLKVYDIGDSIWWVGSEAHYDRYEVITWMDIPEGTGEQIAAQLAHSLGLGDPASMSVTWDDHLLMARTPRFIARQLSRFLPEP